MPAVTRIAIASDHAGFTLKEEIAAQLRREDFHLLDLGTYTTEPVDYPDYARAIGKAIQEDKAERGILVCGSGVGACVAANKMRGVRAGLCHDTYSARQGVEHDDMNVLCLGARIIGDELARELSPKNRMIFDSMHYLNYFRLWDNRMIFGGRAAFFPENINTIARSAEILRRAQRRSTLGPGDNRSQRRRGLAKPIVP